MNIEFKLPELGENIDSGDVVSVLVREGDVIAGNDGVVEVETDKAVVEIPCPHAGKIAKVHVAKGQTIKVGQPLLTIEAEESAMTQTNARKAGDRKPQASQDGQCPRNNRPGPLPKRRGELNLWRPGPRRDNWPANWASISPGSRQRQGRTDYRRGRPRSGGTKNGRGRDGRRLPKRRPRARRPSGRIGPRRLRPRTP